QRRLARAALADQGQALALAQVEGDAADRLHAAAAGRLLDRQVAHRQDDVRRQVAWDGRRGRARAPADHAAPVRSRGLNSSSSERVIVTSASWTTAIAMIGPRMYIRLSR